VIFSRDPAQPRPWFLWNLYLDPALGSFGQGFDTTEGS
jgi:hypothetical protein